MVPTHAGETLLEHARAVLARLDRIERDMSGYAKGASGQVRLLCTASVLEESLAQDVADFLSLPAHRDLQVSWKSTTAGTSCRAFKPAQHRSGFAGMRWICKVWHRVRIAPTTS
jgi:hypothetical protein